MLTLMQSLGWQGAIFPMNAQDSKKKKDKLMQDDNYVAETKYDGSRFLSISGRFFSRVASVTDGLPTERTGNVPHLAVAMENYPGVVLDGEVYYPGKKSNHVTSVMGASSPKAIARQQDPNGNGWIRYVVYDILLFNGEWLVGIPWVLRRQLLEEFYKTLKQNGDDEYIDLSQYAQGEDKEKLLEDVLADGGEGIMLKNRLATYSCGARPANVWYKVKTEITYDVVVMGYEEGQGKYTGMVGAVVFGLYKDGVLTECGRTSGMTDAVRQEITDSKQMYLDRVMEIEAMERTEKGMFRHPRFLKFRDDKTADMCTWEES